MLQNGLTILIVLGALGWGAWYVFRWFVPGSKRTGCAGGCGCGKQAQKSTDHPTPPAQERTLFVPTADLVTRLKARK